MNNNVNFEKNNYVFNYRVAAVIKKEDKILVQEQKNVKYFSLPGGRCEMGEDSITTMKREIKEELGLDITIIKPTAIIENFFKSSYNGKNYHEMLIVYDVSFNDKEIYKNEIINNIEETKKDDVICVWKSLEELSNSDFKPKVLLNFIKSDKFVHYINKD